MLWCENCRCDCLEYSVVVKHENKKLNDANISLDCQITYCKKCGKEVWNPEVENDNLTRLYSEYDKVRRIKR